MSLQAKSNKQCFIYLLPITVFIYYFFFFNFKSQMRCVNPTKSLERKVQRTLRKIKHKFEENEYKKLYPTGSRPGLFYGKPKVHKLEQQH